MTRPWLLAALLLVACGAPVRQPPRAAVFEGDCPPCTDAVVSALRADPRRHWQVEVVSRDLAQALPGADLLVLPGGNEDLADTWRRLSGADLRAVDAFVRGGGKDLGICLGAYLAGDFQSLGHRVGWRWLNAAEYRGPLQGDVMEALVKTRWEHPSQTRLLYFSEGTSFGRVPPPRGRVMARYPNGEIAALITPVGHGTAGVIGPHLEADEDWYDLDDLHDTDGYDTDLLYDFLDALLS